MFLLLDSALLPLILTVGLSSKKLFRCVSVHSPSVGST